MPTDQSQPKPGSTVENTTARNKETQNNQETPREKQLLERIRQLEEMNSALQDKLDMIWSILEPDYELPADAEEHDGGDDHLDDNSGGLVQIQGLK